MGAETGTKARVKVAKIKAEKRQVRLAGFGGQGIVLAGLILGKAVALFEESNAVMTQSYGPEARGGACSADVVISGLPDQQILDNVEKGIKVSCC